GQDAGNVPGHVAVADDGDFAGRQVPVLVRVRVGVVPGHEVRAAVGAVQVDARDVQVRVLLGAGGDDDRVVAGAQVIKGDVAAQPDVSVEVDPVVVQHLVQGGDDALDAR